MMSLRFRLWLSAFVGLLCTPGVVHAGPLVGALVLAAGLSGTVAAVATFVVTTLIAIGVNKLVNALFGSKPKQQDRQASVLSLNIGEVPREVLFGTTATGGSLDDGGNYGGEWGTDWNLFIITVADHKCHSLIGFYVNDTYVAFTGDGPVAGYNGQLEVYWRDGSATQTLPGIVTNIGWSATDNCGGEAKVVVAYKADAPQQTTPVFTGRPALLWVVKGKLCYIARKDSSVGGSGAHRWNDPITWEWTDNLIDCRYNYTRGVFAKDLVGNPEHLLVGRGLTSLEAPEANNFAYANTCDEDVPLAAGGTIKRYTFNGVIRANEQFGSVERKFAECCAGMIIQTGGAIEVEPGAARSITFSFSDDDLVSGEEVSWSPFRSTADAAWVNTVVPRYIEPIQKWQDHAAPVRRMTGDLTSDGGPREQALPLTGVTNGNQAGRVAEIVRRLGRFVGSGGVVLPPRFAGVTEGDWGQWTSARRFGGLTKTVRVDAYGLDGKWRNKLMLREIGAACYSWTTADEAASSAVATPQTPPTGGWARGYDQVNFSQVYGTTRPADNATVGAVAGTNLYRGDGSTVLTQGDVRTIEGVAAAISGQTAWATETTPVGAVLRPPPNVVPDGGLRFGARGWTLGGWYLSLDYAPYLATTTGGLTCYSPAFSALPGSSFTLAADMTATASLIGIQAVWYNPDGSFNSVGTSALITQAQGGGRPSVTVTCPVGVATGRIAVTSGTITGAQFATVARVKGEWGSVATPFSDEATETASYDDGTNITALQPEEASANRTEGHTAAAIAGQGPGATAGAASVLNSYVSIAANGSLAGGGGGAVTFDGLGGGDVGLRDTIYFGDGYLRRADGTTVAYDGDYRTALGTAAAILGQGALATRATVNSSYIDDYSIAFSDLTSTASRLGTNIVRADGSTSVTDAAAITALGTAAAISGQADWATYTGLSTSTVAGRTGRLNSTGYGLIGSLGLLADETNSYWITNANAVTALGTAAAIAGQGALATQGSVNLATQVTGALGPGNAAAGLVNSNVTISAAGALSGGGGGAVTFDGLGGGDVGLRDTLYFGDGYLRRADGMTIAYDADYRTVLGTAAAISGQGALATRGTINSSYIDDGSIAFSDLTSTAARLGTNIVRADGSTSVTDAAAITALGTAAAISGQADWATYTGLSTSTVAGRTGRLNSTGFGFLGSGGLLADETNSYWITNSNAVTALGTAAAIAGQGALATRGTVNSSYIDDGSIAFSDLTSTAGRFGTNIVRADGSTSVTDAAAITALGTAAAISGQGAWATETTPVGAVLRPEVNLCYDGGLSLSGARWYKGVSGYWYRDSRDYLILTSSDDYAYPARFAASAGVTYTGQAEVHTVGAASAFVRIFFYDAADAFLSASSPSAAYPASAGNNKRTVTATAPTGTVWSRLAIFAGTMTSGQYIAISKAKCAAETTASIFSDDTTNGALYDDGTNITALQPEEGLANRTEGHTAAAIAGQGALATRGTVNSSYIDDGSIAYSDLTSTATRLGTNIVQADGSTSVTDAAAITALGTAAAISGQADWATYSGLSTGTVAGRTSRFGTTGRASDTRALPPIVSLSLGYKFTGAISYSATAGSPATATISVGAGTALIGSSPISYNAMSVGVTGTDGTSVTYYLYVTESADPASWGGSKTLIATTDGNDIYASENNMWVGYATVAYPASGGGSGAGGGGGGGGGGGPIP